MKNQPSKQPKPEIIQPSAKVGDSVFFDHPKIGAHSGKVIAAGKHGATVQDDKGTAHKVHWHAIRGHKARAITHATVVDKGEDGYICKDTAGKRFFVRGDYEDFGVEDPTLKPKEATEDKKMNKCLLLIKR